MEKINLERILKNHIDLSDYDDFTAQARVIDAMKEIWNLAVDKCKENATATLYRSENDERMDSTVVDLYSIEQVKQLIK